MRTCIHILLLVGVLLFVYATAFTQAGKIPPFRIVQSNGKLFKAEDLPIGKPVIIIYFSPDCDHCIQLMKGLFKRSAELKKASVAMITYLPVDKVSKFIIDYNLSKHPNFYVGTEGNSLFVRNYYKIVEMPFMALYTKKGDLIKSYVKDDALNDLFARLNQLK